MKPSARLKVSRCPADGMLSVNCPNCGAAMRLEDDRDFLVCDFCKHTHFPDPNTEGIRVLSEPAHENCPVCRIGLVHAAMAKQRILYCERCRGLLIPMEDFLGLVQALRADATFAPEPARPMDQKALDRAIDCPRCGQRMNTHPYAGPGAIIIDNCHHCGVNWLDYRELRRIVTAPERQYNPDGWVAP